MTMKQKFVPRIAAVVAALLMLSACGGDTGSIDVEDATYRVTREDLGAGYLTITNTTGDDVTLTSVSADGVGRIELHESMLAEDGTMAMESRPEGFVVAAGESVSLEPGGKHLMLFDPTTDGEDLNLTLTFDDEDVEIVAAFDAAASASTMDDMDHSEHDDPDDDHSEHGDDGATEG